jgi:hypothetical protein
VRACWQSKKTERECVNCRVEVHNGYNLKAVDDYCVTWCISVHPLRSDRTWWEEQGAVRVLLLVNRERYYHAVSGERV